MLCTINDFYLCDETLEGGWSLKGLRVRTHRYFDIVIPIAELDPVLLDRNKRRVDISFSVERVHDSIKAAEEYINDHDTLIPRTGDIKLITMGTETVISLVINGALLSHELVRQIGKFTEHAYRISGSTQFAPTPGADHLVTEGGDTITTEGGDKLVVE